MKAKLILTGLCALLLAASSPALAGGTFESLPFGGSFFPGGMNMSNDGNVLAGYWGGAPLYYFVDSGEQWAVPVGDASPPGLNISGDGSTITGTQIAADGKNHAATFDIATLTWTMLDDNPDSEGCDASFSSAWDCNYDGSIVGGMSWIPGCDAEAHRWDDGVPTALGRFDDRSSRVSVVSDDASVMGGWAELADGGYRRPAIWTDDVEGPQHFLGTDVAGEVYGTDYDGSQLVGAVNTFAYHYDMDTDTFTDIGSLYGDIWGSAAFDVSEDGLVVGRSGDPFFSTPYALAWTFETGIMYLGDYLTAMGVSGYNDEWLYDAWAISDDGKTIIGSYVNPDDFLLYPYIVHIEDTTPAFLASFDVQVSPGLVDFDFQVSGDATAETLTLTATKDGVSWDVQVAGSDEHFSAQDRHARLQEGGSVDYALSYTENGETFVLRNENVQVESAMLSTRLLGAHPNPFNPATKIAFSLENAQRVQVNVVDLQGRVVSRLADQSFASGRHDLNWDGTNSAGEAMASGVYFVQMLSEDGGMQRQKLTLLK